MNGSSDRSLDRLYLMDMLSAFLVVVAIGITLVAAAIWLEHREYFALQSVLVESADDTPLHHVNIASVRANALPSITGNFFSVNLAAVREAFESVAWVRHARVRRQWPNRLVVAVEEHKAVALWNDDALVNNFGESFTANLAEAEADGELPQLNGPQGSQKDVLEHYAAFTRDFTKVQLRPTEVTLSPRYSWSVRFDNATNDGLLVEFGREDDGSTLNGRIDRMLATYPIVTAKWPHLTLVDLRYPNGFAIRADNLRLASEPGKKSAKPAPHASHTTAKPQPLKT